MASLPGQRESGSGVFLFVGSVFPVGPVSRRTGRPVQMSNVVPWAPPSTDEGATKTGVRPRRTSRNNTRWSTIEAARVGRRGQSRPNVLCSKMAALLSGMRVRRSSRESVARFDPENPADFELANEERTGEGSMESGQGRICWSGVALSPSSKAIAFIGLRCTNHFDARGKLC